MIYSSTVHINAFNRKARCGKGSVASLKGLTMAMQILLDGQWVTVERDDRAKAYIITSPDGSEEKIPFGQKEESD